MGCLSYGWLSNPDANLHLLMREVHDRAPLQWAQAILAPDSAVVVFHSGDEVKEHTCGELRRQGMYPPVEAAQKILRTYFHWMIDGRQLAFDDVCQVARAEMNWPPESYLPMCDMVAHFDGRLAMVPSQRQQRY